MLKEWIKPLGTLAGIAVLASGAFCQEAAPAQKPTEPAKEKEAQAAEEPTPAPKNNSITVFGSTWNSGGLNRRFASYGYVPSGLGLADLSILNAVEGKPYLRFNWTGQPTQDVSAQGLGILSGATMLRVSYDSNKHYQPSWQPTPVSGDSSYNISLERELRPNLGAYATYDWSDRTQGFAAPNPTNQTQTRTYGFGVEGKVGGGQAGVNYTEQRVSNITGFQPLTLVDRTEAHYGRDFGSNFSVEGIAAYARIQQQGLSNSGVRSYGLKGLWGIDDDTTLQLNFSRQDLNLPNVQNAYVRKRYDTGLKLSHRWDKWGLKLGLRHREDERVNADHTSTDVPKWNIAEGQITGRLAENTRLSIKGTWQNLTNAATYQADDPTQLQWDDQVSGQVKLDGGDEKFSWFGAYNYRLRSNVARDVSVTWNSFSVGGSHQFTPKVLGFVEFSRDEIHAVGAKSPTDSLAYYFPTSQTASFGIDCTVNPTDAFSASFNYFESGDELGSQLALRYRRQLPKDRSLEVMVAPWYQTDRMFQLVGYNYTLMMVKYSAKF